MKITGDEFAQCQAGGMNAKELCDSQFDGGLTIRQEFAARAMQGIIGSEMIIGKHSYNDVAAASVTMADALIAELNKPKT